ncbi:MAG: alpha-L-fucosidase [Cyclobacteriaceae bacterium]
MKRLFVLLVLFVGFSPAFTQTYTPTPENLASRKAFQDARFGMFIHWGASSVLGAGEWVMNNRNIKVKDYTRLQQIFNPQQFNAAEWVATAKSAGMKYIVFITRHHDGFSNWDTNYSDWKITNTPYGKDVLKLLADECKKQNMKLGLYYSTLDWYRSDYPYETGRTGKGTGRTEKSNYAAYLQFMKNQLTELLTNYGEIMSIWFDGHWDQTNPEGHADMTSRIDWKYDEIYSLIHRLQPQCLIGNNHHLEPLPGEDFQMFEKDLPGQNKTGLSFQAASESLPLETCETMNGSWGYNITDNNYKTVKELVRYLVNAAGLNTNFLLNVGPMPSGQIQTEFVDTLKVIGSWLAVNGESVYGTRGNVIEAQEWGAVTAKNKIRYVHILHDRGEPYIFLPGFQEKVKDARMFGAQQKVRFKQLPEGVFIYTEGLPKNKIDTIIELLIQ